MKGVIVFCYQQDINSTCKKLHIALGQAAYSRFTPIDNKQLIGPNNTLDSAGFIIFYINRIRVILADSDNRVYLYIYV